jgi:hypothetical protein
MPSAINLLAMPHGENEYDHFFVPDVADQAIVSHTIPPQALLLAVKRLAPLAGILGWQQTFAQKTLD